MADTNKVPPTISLALTSFVPTAGQTKSIQLSEFNGIDTSLNRNADYTSNVDCDIIVVSLWIKWLSQDLSNRTFYRIEDGFVSFSTRLRRLGTGEYHFEVKNASGDVVIIVSSNGGPYGVSTGVHHLLIQIDSSSASNSFIFIDDVDRTDTSLKLNDGPFDVTMGDHIVASVPITAFTNICLGDMFLLFKTSPPSSFPSIDDVAHRRNFISSDLKPIEFGADGSRPYGEIPIAFFSGNVDSWHLNDGSGGGMTENGALISCGNHPPVDNNLFPTGGNLSLSSSPPYSSRC